MRERKLKARAKINLGLDVLGRRPDGYHDLRMVMQTVELCDEITLRTDDIPDKAQGKSRPGMVWASTAGTEAAGPQTGQGEAAGPGSNIHITVGGDVGQGLVPADSDNLAYRAAYLLMEEFGISQRLEILLEKRIPVAAGLAGGSSDAAAVMVGVNELFDLNLTQQELMERGVRIGADVPYCILRGTALAEGIGERLTRLPDAPGAWVVLAKPPVQVSTRFVYSNLKLDERAAAGPADSRRQNEGIFRHPDIDAQVQAIHDGDLCRMASLMGNVLETVTIPAFPVIREIQEQMREFGAVNVMMSGSGPTVFGLFDDREKAERAYTVLKSGSLAAEVFLTTFFCPSRE